MNPKPVVEIEQKSGISELYPINSALSRNEPKFLTTFLILQSELPD